MNQYDNMNQYCSHDGSQPLGSSPSVVRPKTSGFFAAIKAFFRGLFRLILSVLTCGFILVIGCLLTASIYAYSNTPKSKNTQDGNINKMTIVEDGLKRLFGGPVSPLMNHQALRGYKESESETINEGAPTQVDIVTQQKTKEGVKNQSRLLKKTFKFIKGVFAAIGLVVVPPLVSTGVFFCLCVHTLDNLRHSLLRVQDLNRGLISVSQKESTTKVTPEKFNHELSATMKKIDEADKLKLNSEQYHTLNGEDLMGYSKGWTNDSQRTAVCYNADADQNSESRWSLNCSILGGEASDYPLTSFKDFLNLVMVEMKDESKGWTDDQRKTLKHMVEKGVETFQNQGAWATIGYLWEHMSIDLHGPAHVVCNKEHTRIVVHDTKMQGLEIGAQQAAQAVLLVGVDAQVQAAVVWCEIKLKRWHVLPHKAIKLIMSNGPTIKTDINEAQELRVIDAYLKERWAEQMEVIKHPIDFLSALQENDAFKNLLLYVQLIQGLITYMIITTIVLALVVKIVKIVLALVAKIEKTIVKAVSRS